MSKALVERYGVNVPRYTSYPTAPHFHEGVQDSVYRDWLGALDAAAPLSLYFHVPFCAEMCSFCGCHTKVVRRYEPVARYLKILQAEVDIVATALPGRFGAAFVHWGGGSPTMLRGDDWRRIHDHLRGAFEFDAEAEMAVELDPRTATQDYIQALAAAGVNRVSLGVQDLNEKVQVAIRRVQLFDMTARVVDWLRQADITAINLDLMYGLPHQTLDMVLASIDQAVSLKPSRIALFGYAHVPWMKSHQKLIDEKALPDAMARFAQSEAAAQALEAAGYHRIGLDHFANADDTLVVAHNMGTLRRNFQGYTNDAASALLGFGTSAIGALPLGYVQNDPDMRPYAKVIEDGRLPIRRGVALSADDRLRRDVIERLMCDMAVNLDVVLSQHDMAQNTLDEDLASLGPLVTDGIVRVTGRQVQVTAEGRPFARVAAAKFDAYLASNRGRHAIAV